MIHIDQKRALGGFAYVITFIISYFVLDLIEHYIVSIICGILLIIWMFIPNKTFYVGNGGEQL